MSDVVERVLGPHEWGYRDPVEGGFVEDTAPYIAGEEIIRQRAVIETLTAALGCVAKQCRDYDGTPMRELSAISIDGILDTIDAALSTARGET